MDLTDIRIYPVNDDSKRLALVSITIGNKLVIRNISIVEGRNDLFVKMPVKKFNDEYYDIVFPIDIEFRENMKEAILSAYQNKICKDIV